MTGFVSIVGAGPWDPDLLTLAARDRLARADVVIADYLVNPAVLLHCRNDVLLFQRRRPRKGPVAPGTPPPRRTLDQAEVNALLVEHGADKRVVRLKGGDPMIFGRGAEEAGACRAAGIEFEFVPGVSSAIATPEYAGIPVTHRDHSPAVCLVSGYEAYAKKGLEVAWEHLANCAGTLVLLMSVRNARANAERLIAAGRKADTPVAVVRWGTRGIQRTVTGTLETIADAIDRAGLRAPAVMVVGEVVSKRDEIEWLESRPLFNKRIAITRPAESARPLLQALAEKGADAVAVPGLAFAPPPNRAALLDAVRREYDTVVLTSTRGVDAYFDALLEATVDLRRLPVQHIAVVGPATQARVAQRGVLADIVAQPARAEGLVDALAEGELLSKRALYVRADEVRSVLRDAFTQAGGDLHEVIGYQSVLPNLPPSLLDSLAPPNGGGEGLDVVLLSSPKSIRNLIDMLDAHFFAGYGKQILAQAKLIAIGQVTAAAAAEHGLTIAAVPDSPSHDDVLACIEATVTG